MAKKYLASVADRGKSFRLEVPRPLRLGATVRHDGAEYRVAYVYQDGRQPIAVLRTVKAKRGRPRRTTDK